MVALTWRELGGLEQGARVRLVRAWHVCPERVFGAGTTGTVVTNNLNELASELYILPDDLRLCIVLGQWNGCLCLSPDVDEWDILSPVARA